MRTRLTHGYRNGLHCVVPHSLNVPRLLERLGVACRVRRAARKNVLAGCRVPAERPGSPREGSRGFVEHGIAPDPVDSGLDACDRRDPGPGAAADLDAPACDGSLAREEVGEAGRNQERARTDSLDGLAAIFSIALVSVRDRLLITLEPLRQRLDPNQPLDVRHPVPAGNEQPQRGAVLRLERATVHLVGEENLRALRIVEAETARVIVLAPLLDPVIGPDEDDLHGTRLDPRILEHARERGASPFCGADRFVEPWLADRTRMQSCAAVAGTLERDQRGPARSDADVVERESELAPDVAADAQPPGGLIDRRNVEVNEQIVQPAGGHVVAQRFEG